MTLSDGREMGIINMWYENLKEAVERFGIKELHFTIFNGKGAVVSHPDMPEDWYIQKLFMKYNCGLNDWEARKVREYYKIDVS